MEKEIVMMGHLVLINLVVACLPIFVLSFFEVPRGVLDKIDISDRDYIGRVINKSTNMDQLNGIFCANRRFKVARNT
jgi:hypothetical protein